MMLASSPADIAVFGGAAGGGKTFSLVLEGARLAAYPRAGGIFFRREAVEITGPGSLWAKSQELYPSIGGESRKSPVREWFWANGTTLEMRHLQHEDDVYGHQGKEYDLIGLDEGTHFTQVQIEYLLSRMRSAYAGFKPYMRITCNPDPTHIIRTWIDWWIGPDGLPIHERAGKLRWWVRHNDEMVWSESPAKLKAKFPKLEPKSFTFIPSTLDDNPILLARDPGYRGNLLALGEVEKQRLLGGNWNVADMSNLVYRVNQLTNVVESRPPNYGPHWLHVVGVDFGYVDECAWVVWGCHPYERIPYMLYAYKEPRLLADQAAERTAKLVAEYRPYALVGDAGGLGKPYVEEFNRRWATRAGMPMIAADKPNKLGHIKTFNDELGGGRYRIVRGACQAFLAEANSLRWSDGTRTRPHPLQPDHVCDAALYSSHWLYSYLNEAPDAPPHPSKDPAGHDAWMERQEIEEHERMERSDELEAY